MLKIDRCRMCNIQNTDLKENGDKNFIVSFERYCTKIYRVYSIKKLNKFEIALNVAKRLKV